MTAGRRHETERRGEEQRDRTRQSSYGSSVYGSSAIVAYVFHCLCISHPSHPLDNPHPSSSFRVVCLNKFIHLSIHILIDHRISHLRHSLLARSLVDRYTYQSNQPLAHQTHQSYRRAIPNNRANIPEFTSLSIPLFPPFPPAPPLRSFITS